MSARPSCVTVFDCSLQEALRKEVEERNATVGQKESRILEVKQRNQELQKYRFVLDYKINELEDELGTTLTLVCNNVTRSESFLYV